MHAILDSWALILARQLKISGIGPWVSRIDRCKGHWCSSTYIDVRLSDISSKIANNTKNAFLACFRAYVRQPYSHTHWAKSMPLASINPITQGPIYEIFARKFWELAILKNSIFLSQPFCFLFFASSLWKSVANYVLEWMELNF